MTEDIIDLFKKEVLAQHPFNNTVSIRVGGDTILVSSDRDIPDIPVRFMDYNVVMV